MGIRAERRPRDQLRVRLFLVCWQEIVERRYAMNTQQPQVY